ncbi:MAG: hypothetical protein WHS82_06385, partial [Candidatus Methanosuratincola sp.]
PGGEPKVLHFRRANEILPPAPKEIKPHLLSMEPGALLEMRSNDTCCTTAKQFLVRHFVRISEAKAEELLKASGLKPSSSPKEIDVEALLKAARECDLMRPPLDVLSPIGEDALRQSIRRIYPDAEFICTSSRDPWSYRGVPFQIEVGSAYGGQSVIEDCERVKEGVFKSRVIRLANKCPLIYDSKDCLLYKVVKEINWRNYKLPQDEGNLPMAPLVIIVSLVSTKVPYSVPGKFAVAYHEEIREQLRLALQSLGRLIQGYISRRQRQEHEQHRQSIFQIYAKEVARDISVLTGGDQAVIYSKLIESIKSKQKAKASKKPEAQPLPMPAPEVFPIPPEKKMVEGIAEIPPPKPKKQQFTLEEYLR